MSELAETDVGSNFFRSMYFFVLLGIKQSEILGLAHVCLHIPQALGDQYKSPHLSRPTHPESLYFGSSARMSPSRTSVLSLAVLAALALAGPSAAYVFDYVPCGGEKTCYGFPEGCQTTEV